MGKETRQVSLELTVETYRDLDTNEEVTDFRVESDQLERPTAGDSPEEALRVLADMFENEDGDTTLDFEEIAEEPDDEDWMEV